MKICKISKIHLNFLSNDPSYQNVFNSTIITECPNFEYFF